MMINEVHEDSLYLNLLEKLSVKGWFLNIENSNSLFLANYNSDEPTAELYPSQHITVF